MSLLDCEHIMTEFREKYINPFTDYGFKKLFGEEPNKDLLLDFLNELLKEEQGEIISLTYLKNENLGNPNRTFSRTEQFITPPFRSGNRQNGQTGTINLRRSTPLPSSTLYLMRIRMNRKSSAMMSSSPILKPIRSSMIN